MTTINVSDDLRCVEEQADDRCLVCGAVDSRPSVYGGYQFKGKAYRLRRCRRCVFRWISPVPSLDTLAAMYGDDEYFDCYNLGDSDIQSYETQATENNLLGQQLLDVLEPYRPGARLFEIGCAGGRLLRQFAEAGFQVSGIEPNQRMVDFASNVLGLNVFQGWFPDERITDRFDVIVMADVLEHVREPHAVLAAAAQLLKPGGLLLIAQPLDYHWTLFNGVLGLAQWWRGRPLADEQPHHLWQFTPSTLRRYLGDRHWQLLNDEVYESPALPSHAFRGTPQRQHVVAMLRRVSEWCSQSALGRRCEWGNRMIVLAQKPSSVASMTSAAIMTGGQEHDARV